MDFEYQSPTLKKTNKTLDKVKQKTLGEKKGSNQEIDDFLKIPQFQPIKLIFHLLMCW